MVRAVINNRAGSRSTSSVLHRQYSTLLRWSSLTSQRLSHHIRISCMRLCLALRKPEWRNLIPSAQLASHNPSRAHHVTAGLCWPSCCTITLLEVIQNIVVHQVFSENKGTFTSVFSCRSVFPLEPWMSQWIPPWTFTCWQSKAFLWCVVIFYFLSDDKTWELMRCELWITCLASEALVVQTCWKPLSTSLKITLN